MTGMPTYVSAHVPGTDTPQRAQVALYPYNSGRLFLTVRVADSRPKKCYPANVLLSRGDTPCMDSRVSGSVECARNDGVVSVPRSAT